MINNYPNDICICLGIALVIGLCSCSPASKEQVGTAASEVEAREIAFAKTMAIVILKHFSVSYHLKRCFLKKTKLKGVTMQFLKPGSLTLRVRQRLFHGTLT